MSQASLVLKASGIFPCIDCKHALLPYKGDDFHMNAQCYSPKNRTLKVSPVTHTEYPEFKQQFCKDNRSDERFCGPSGKWFESKYPSVEKISAVKETDGNKTTD